MKKILITAIAAFVLAGCVYEFTPEIEPKDTSGLVVEGDIIIGDTSRISLSAVEALTKVRDRASVSLPAVPAGTVDSFRAAVKHERRVELAFEDHRYWDLLRWKDAMSVLNSPVQGVKVTRTGDSYTYKVVDVADRTFSARNYYLPLMRSEIENAAGTLEQNPGY